MPDYKKEFVILDLADFRLYIFVEIVFGFQEVGS